MVAKIKRLQPVHPGDLLGRIMQELGISCYALAQATGKTPTQIHRIVNRKAGISASMALLIGKALDTSAEMWLKLQSQYDLEVAELQRPDVVVKQLVDGGKKVA